MKAIDIEGELHWSGKERMLVLLGGFGLLAGAIVFTWWFNAHIPIRFLQFMWSIFNAVMGMIGLSSIIIAIIPRRTLWLMDILSAFFGGENND